MKKIFALAMVGLISVPAVAQEKSVGTLIDNVLARAECVFSGRLGYRLVLSMGDGNNRKILEDSKCQFDFMGDDWINRQRLAVEFEGGVISQTNTQASYGGESIRYAVGSGGPGMGGRHATLEESKPVSREKDPPPYFAGTLWRKCTIEYLRDHRDDVVAVGSEEIDGVPIAVLELKVPVGGVGQAFHILFGEMAEEGGILRLFVATNLGGALLRVEHATGSGVVYERFDSRGFHEVAGGIFFPSECSRRILDSAGSTTFSWKYVFEQVESINEILDESLFVFEIPPGTPVADLREPGRRGVIIPSATKSEDLPVIFDGNRKRMSQGRMWLSGASFTCVVVVVAWFVLRTRRLRKKEALQ